LAARSPLVAVVDAQDLAALKRALATHHGPLPARLVVGAAGKAWTAGLAELHRHGADLNGTYKNYRALHALMQTDPHQSETATAARVKCLEWLLTHGADPDQLAAWPAARALVIAAFVGEPKYVDALKRHGPETNIFTAASLGDASKVGALLAKNPALATARDGGLLTALQCCAGSRLGTSDSKLARALLKVAQLLIDAGADANAAVKTWGHDVAVSYFAIRSGQVEMLTFLLEHGLEPTVAVSTAAWESREDILDLLIAHGARIDQSLDGTKPVLNELVRWGQFKPARLLLSKRASPNAPDDRGWTAVHQAVSRGNLKMLEDLMEAGGDATVKDRDGRTPRDMARASRRNDLLWAMEDVASS
jgi:ankyrin repeat protein